MATPIDLTSSPFLDRITRTSLFDDGLIQSDGAGYWSQSRMRSIILDGAIMGGVYDCTVAVQATIDYIAAKGGGWVFVPPGIFLISGTLNVTNKNVVIIGLGNCSVLRGSLSFSGASFINITADNCAVKDIRLDYASSTSANNPTGNAINITGARSVSLMNLQFSGINGYAIEHVGTASVNNVGSVMHAIHINHCAKGMHIQGVGGSNYVGQMFISAFHPEAIDNGDALFLEDINDIEVMNMNGAVAGGAVAGSMVHVKGNCNSNFFTNVDLGANSQSTVSPTILVESGNNGSPSNLNFVNGVIQKGSNLVSVTSGGDILFNNIKFKSANGDGISVSGGAGPFTFDNCQFATNNQGNGTAYDINLTHTTGFSYIKNCLMQSPVGSGAGSVTNPANDLNHRGYFINTHFAGSGNTPSTAFNNTPQIVRGCVGYNPRGSITPTAITASPFTGNASQNDIQIVFTAINNMTDFKIGTQSIGVPAVGVPIRIPARQAFTITYGATAPTYLWFSD